LGFSALINSSLAKSTWGKYKSGYNAFACFEASRCSCSPFPIPVETIRSFVIWCHFTRNLAPSTIKAYISSLKFIHHIQGFQSSHITEDTLLPLLMKGSGNLTSQNNPRHNSRRVVTLPVLLTLGSRIASSKWDPLQKQVIWSACTTGFFGSFRMGELLAPTESNFSPTTHLTWNDVRASSPTSILIRISQPKSGEPGGEYVDLFPFLGFHCCPVLALKNLREKQQAQGMTDDTLPVFRFTDRKYLTMHTLNQILASLLQDMCTTGINTISCHSFRAGIPSTLSLFPDLATSDLIKGWGRWHSDCYQRYTRLKLPQKLNIFEKITTALHTVADSPP